MGPQGPGPLVTCDMVYGCAGEVTKVDEKGFVYCDEHGRDRKEGGWKVRKLRGWELRRVKDRRPLSKY